jgi:hypothetical protein
MFEDWNSSAISIDNTNSTEENDENQYSAETALQMSKSGRESITLDDSMHFLPELVSHILRGFKHNCHTNKRTVQRMAWTMLRK